MNRLFLTLAICLLTALQAVANVPSLRRSLTRHQSDGTTITVSRIGNAFYGFYSTTDGMALLANADGDLCYTTLSDSGLVVTPVVAHESDARTADELQTVANAATSEAALTLLQSIFPINYTASTGTMPSISTQSFNVSTADGVGAYGKSANGIISSIGSPVVPVIMAEFSDNSFQDTITIEKYTRWFNEEGYADEPNCVGSVRDYFLSQSNGLFSPTFVVLGKVKLSQPQAYYGQNTSSSSDRYKFVFVQEVLDSAVAAGFDFTDYLVDGKVPNVAIIYAGPGEQSSFEDGCDDYIWAHYNTRSFTAGGISFSSYLAANELLQSYNSEGTVVTGARIDGIGVFTHEFCHVIGLPDFYYTGSNATIKDTLLILKYWSIMDYGEYYADGYAPTGLLAYERSTMGWLNIQELIEAQAATLYPFGHEDEGNTAYLIRNSNCNTEYYILENRQPDTWYPSVMGSGMLITHVDYSASAWSGSNINNTPSHLRFTYVPADNTKTVSRSSLMGDLYPGTTNSTSFTDGTTPASTVYNGTSGYLGKPIYNIAESDEGIITFSYLDESLTGISTVDAAAHSAAPAQAYTADGRRVSTLSAGEGAESLAPGIYIVRTQGNVQKIKVK